MPRIVDPMTIAATAAPARRTAPRDPALAPIARKVEAGERLTAADGATLFETTDVHGVMRLADLVLRRLHGDQAFFNINRHLNYSNICALSCKFCAFHRKKDQDGAYEHSLEDIRADALK